MAEIVSFREAVRARRAAVERESVRRCIEIVEVNLQHVLRALVEGPESERPVRARQIRQLAELLEYLVRI